MLNWFMMLLRSTISFTFLSIHSINFESLILKHQLKKNLNLSTQKITVIYSGTICNCVLCFPSLLVKVLSYFHNLKNEKDK